MQAQTRVVHCKKAAYDVYIGRGRGNGNVWGNPFTHIANKQTLAQFVMPSRESAIAAHRKWFVQQPALMARLGELRGKTLGCWCHPLSCHGDFLAELANALPSAPAHLSLDEILVAVAPVLTRYGLMPQ